MVLIAANIIHLLLLTPWFIFRATRELIYDKYIVAANVAGLLASMLLTMKWTDAFDNLVSRRQPQANGTKSDDDKKTRRMLLFIITGSLSLYHTASRSSMWFRLEQDMTDLILFYATDFCTCVFYYNLLAEFRMSLPSSLSESRWTIGRAMGLFAFKIIILRIPLFMYQVFAILTGARELMIAFLGSMFVGTILTILVHSTVQLIWVITRTERPDEPCPEKAQESI